MASRAPRGNPASRSYFSQRLRLHYLDWGNEGLPPMLMLHGIHDHCHRWDWVAERLRHRFRIVAPDLRGHGDSQWSRGSSYAMTEYVQDVAQLVRQARLAPVNIVAHSMGGSIAALHAGIYPVSGSGGEARARGRHQAAPAQGRPSARASAQLDRRELRSRWTGA